MTGYCTTWSGEGDAAAGTRQAATEIDFHTDIDEDGIELVRKTVLPITVSWNFIIPLCCRAMQQPHVPSSNSACFFLKTLLRLAQN